MMSDNMSENEEKVVKCGNCHKELKGCNDCGDEFEDGKEIICFRDGDYHFCSEKCMYGFLKYVVKFKAIPTKVFLDD